MGSFERGERPSEASESSALGAPPNGRRPRAATGSRRNLREEGVAAPRAGSKDAPFPPPPPSPLGRGPSI
eukprot:2791708-Pyramimonas_sp.AAC.1